MFNLALFAGCLATLAAAQKKSLVLDTAPNFLRPYVIPHLGGTLLQLGDTAFRFPITGGSTGGSITLLSTNGDPSNALNVFPHRHVRRYENFFCSRGGVQLWTQQFNGTQNVRKLTAGDFGGSPSNATHTFQIVEPNTEMYGVVFAGGLEDMFFALAPNITYAVPAPFDPAYAVSAGSKRSGISARDILADPPPDFGSLFDIYPNTNFIARRDLINGSAPSVNWHAAKNVLPDNPTEPYYVARDLGPKYLSKEYGYQVLQPLSTATQSSYHNFTLTFISIARTSSNTTLPTHKYAGHAGFRVEEGAMMLNVDGYDEVQLLHGDVAFIPGNTSYQYYSKVAYTKVLHFAAETNGLDTTLMAKSVAWNSSVWPTK